MVFSCARGTPILAGGIGVARLVAGAVFCCLSGQVYVSVFACNATGLDAVRRLEQKKSFQESIESQVVALISGIISEILVPPICRNSF